MSGKGRTTAFLQTGRKRGIKKRSITNETTSNKRNKTLKPEELLFAKTHEWTHVADADGGRIATIGISAFAIEQLNDLVYMDLPETGRTVAAGESLGEIESVKAVSDFYSPVAGEVVEVNSPLADSLDTLKEDAYGGWLVKLKITDDAGLKELMDFETYQKQCESEG